MSGKREDLSGKRFGMWEVLYHVKGKLWKCRCDCGTEKDVPIDHLKSGASKSCGCVRRKVHAGDTFGRITVLEKAEGTTWKCKCECGEVFTTSTSHLRDKKKPTVQCAKCTYAERATVNVAENRKAYAMWKDMIYRCENPKSNNYKRYGERGISVCDEWKDFGNFFEWLSSANFDKSMGRQCTIERIDVNGNYEPKNCKLAGQKEQANNKRDNVFVTIGDERKTITQWCEETGVNRSTAYHRIKNGWTPQDAVTIMASKKKWYRRNSNGEKERFVQL